MNSIGHAFPVHNPDLQYHVGHLIDLGQIDCS
ncbi:MAG: hypothetical protein CM15mL1_1870 [Libanvirus sp.]|nr:MAG: hypothetical protein CM15mL1_1870 [Libanvirus sp.]